MFAALKHRAAGLSRRVVDVLLMVADVSGGLLAGSGSAVVTLTGKIMLAVVLGAISLGFFLRLASRRGTRSVAPLELGLRYQLAAASFSVIEVAALTEATNFPIRFNQPGFEPWHWIVVLVALAIGYLLNMRLCAAVFGRRRVAP